VQESEIESRVKVIEEDLPEAGRVPPKKKKNKKIDDVLGTTGSSIVPQDPNGDNMLDTYG
jgi:hypothetical protein